MTWLLDIDYIPDEFSKKAERELGETPEIRIISIEKLRNLLQDEERLRLLSDEELLIFLRAKKFDVDRTLVILKNYLKIKTEIKELSGNVCLDIGLKACQCDMLTLLPNRGDDGCVTMVSRIRYYDTKEFKYVDYLAASSYMLAATLALHPVTQICGVKLILDCRGLTLSHVLNIQIRILRFMCTAMANTFPARFKEAHILCDSNVIPNIWKLTRPFLPHKLQERVNFYGSDISNLRNCYEADVLSQEYGGDSDYDKEMIIEVLKKFWRTKAARFLCTSEG